MRSNYRRIIDFGTNAKSALNDPITYCMVQKMDSEFMHGSNADIYGFASKPCQAYMSQRCAKKWDRFCEIASKNINLDYPNQLQSCNAPNNVVCNGGSVGVGGVRSCNSLTAGEILIRNTAVSKYLVSMGHCDRKWEPFDPNVADSPLISYWTTNCWSDCVPVYEVNPKTVDNDIVMDKILAKPKIASDILINIYNTARRKGKLHEFLGTKLGRFYSIVPYFKLKGGLLI